MKTSPLRERKIISCIAGKFEFEIFHLLFDILMIITSLIAVYWIDSDLTVIFRRDNFLSATIAECFECELFDVWIQFHLLMH
uniref:Uncharacterized protein n=1 Tax=Parascaris univalens TaxID=6257 RepID=A0A915B070_PARUN